MGYLEFLLYRIFCLRKKSHNKKFKADKPVKPVCGLTHCYVDARTGAQGFIVIEVLMKKEYTVENYFNRNHLWKRNSVLEITVH